MKKLSMTMAFVAAAMMLSSGIVVARGQTALPPAFTGGNAGSWLGGGALFGFDSLMVGPGFGGGGSGGYGGRSWDPIPTGGTGGNPGGGGSPDWSGRRVPPESPLRHIGEMSIHHCHTGQAPPTATCIGLQRRPSTGLLLHPENGVPRRRPSVAALCPVVKHHVSNGLRTKPRPTVLSTAYRHVAAQAVSSARS